LARLKKTKTKVSLDSDLASLLKPAQKEEASGKEEESVKPPEALEEQPEELEEPEETAEVAEAEEEPEETAEVAEAEEEPEPEPETEAEAEEKPEEPAEVAEAEEEPEPEPETEAEAEEKPEETAEVAEEEEEPEGVSVKIEGEDTAGRDPFDADFEDSFDSLLDEEGAEVTPVKRGVELLSDGEPDSAVSREDMDASMEAALVAEEAAAAVDEVFGAPQEQADEQVDEPADISDGSLDVQGEEEIIGLDDDLLELDAEELGLEELESDDPDFYRGEPIMPGPPPPPVVGSDGQGVSDAIEDDLDEGGLDASLGLNDFEDISKDPEDFGPPAVADLGDVQPAKQREVTFEGNDADVESDLSAAFDNIRTDADLKVPREQGGEEGDDVGFGFAWEKASKDSGARLKADLPEFDFDFEATGSRKNDPLQNRDEAIKRTNELDVEFKDISPDSFSDESPSDPLVFAEGEEVSPEEEGEVRKDLVVPSEDGDLGVEEMGKIDGVLGVDDMTEKDYASADLLDIGSDDSFDEAPTTVDMLTDAKKEVEEMKAQERMSSEGLSGFDDANSIGQDEEKKDDDDGAEKEAHETINKVDGEDVVAIEGGAEGIIKEVDVESDDLSEEQSPDDSEDESDEGEKAGKKKGFFKRIFGRKE